MPRKKQPPKKVTERQQELTKTRLGFYKLTPQDIKLAIKQLKEQWDD